MDDKFLEYLFVTGQLDQKDDEEKEELEENENEEDDDEDYPLGFRR